MRSETQKALAKVGEVSPTFIYKCVYSSPTSVSAFLTLFEFPNARTNLGSFDYNSRITDHSLWTLDLYWTGQGGTGIPVTRWKATSKVKVLHFSSESDTVFSNKVGEKIYTRHPRRTEARAYWQIPGPWVGQRSNATTSFPHRWGKSSSKHVAMDTHSQKLRSSSTNHPSIR